jgi:hypothetical protein
MTFDHDGTVLRLLIKPETIPLPPLIFLIFRKNSLYYESELAELSSHFDAILANLFRIEWQV